LCYDPLRFILRFSDLFTPAQFLHNDRCDLAVVLQYKNDPRTRFASTPPCYPGYGFHIGPGRGFPISLALWRGERAQGFREWVRLCVETPPLFTHTVLVCVCVCYGPCCDPLPVTSSDWAALPLLFRVRCVFHTGPSVTLMK